MFQTPRPPLTTAAPRRALVVCCVIGGSGLALVILGSFLPWVVSGQVRRSSYEILGIVDRLGVADEGVLGILIANWPWIGLLCMVPVVIGALRWWRTAGLLAIVLALATGVLSFGILIVAGRSVAVTVRVDPIGPSVMAAGAVLLLGAGVALALGVGSPIRRR